MDEDQVNPEHVSSKTTERTGQPENKIPAVTMDVGKEKAKDQPHAASADKKRRKRESMSCFEIWTVVLAVIGILVAGATGLAIYWQDRLAAQTLAELHRQYPKLAESADAAHEAAVTANNALEDARKNFRSDERPYIWLALGPGKTGHPVFETSTGRVVWNWYDENYGKTPPLNLRILSYMKLGSGPFVRSYGQTNKPGAPIPPGIELMSSVYSKPISLDEFNRVFRVDGAIQIKIIIKYTDFSGTPYETGICLLSQPTVGTIGFCDGTYIK